MKPITWSFGGGTQSVAIAVLVARDELPRPDAIIMADTGYEASETWEYLDAHVRPLLSGVGCEVDVVKAERLATTDGLFAKNGKVLMPVFTANGAGQLPNYCTNEWKVRVVQRRLRELGYGPKNPVVTWIGISTDEVHRAKPSGTTWQEHDWPLLMHRPTNRTEAKHLVMNAGLPNPPKSSCYFCPYRGNAQWRRVRDEYPEDWRLAVKYDREIREADPNAFVHRSGVPLDEAAIEPSSQSDLFGEIECDSGYCWV